MKWLLPVMGLLLAAWALLTPAPSGAQELGVVVSSNAPFPLIINGKEVGLFPARTEVGAVICVGSRLYYSSDQERFVFQGWGQGRTSDCIVPTEAGEYRALFSQQILLQIRSKVARYAQSLWVEKGSMNLLEVPPVVEEKPGTRYIFGEWTGGETPFSPTNSIAVFRPMVLEIKWGKEYYITLEGPEGVPLVGFGWYPENQRVVLKAPAEVSRPDGRGRQRFKEWESLSNHATLIPNYQQPTTTITADGSYTIRAKYQQEYLLVVDNPQGNIKKVWVAEGGETTVETPPYIEVVPNQERYSFKAWEGIELGSPQGSLVVDGPRQATALYERQFKVTVSAPYGGSGDGWYTEGATATIEVPGNPSGVLFLKRAFAGFSGYAANGPTLEVAVTGPLTITANYRTQLDWKMLGLIVGVIALAYGAYLFTQRMHKRRLEGGEG